MAFQVLLIVVGLALLLCGGDLLVRGASGLARDLGVTPLIIGMSVVAFGTSSPELAVNVLAASSGNSGISFGNIFGSNIANIGLVLGTAALIRPIGIEAPLVRREIPMMLLFTGAAIILALDPLLGRQEARFSRGDGIILLLLFGVFIFLTALSVVRGRAAADLPGGVESVAATGTRHSIGVDAGLLAIGLLALLGGGRLTVDAAVALARSAGVSETVVGLTIIAVGTSLPELATSAMAARRGAIDLAVGNIVGSNIFNLLFVMGITSVVAPVIVPARGYADLAMTAILSIMMLAVSLTRGRRIFRTEGIVLLALYVAYIAWRTATGSGL